MEHSIEKSRSQCKREMTALQKLGEELASLGEESIRKAPLTPELKTAVLEAKKLRSHEAKRRQMQYIGKLMRSVEQAEISEFLQNIRTGNAKANKNLQQIETWRAELLAGNQELIEDLLLRFPHGDRQKLRQLSLAAKREKERDQAPKQARALFRYLRELLANA